MPESYSIPAKFSQIETEVKKSRFIARSSCVKTREQALAFLAQAKQDYPDARHHCWAYLLGNPHSASSAAMSDDGEPGGTAGKPILNVIQHKDIGDIVVVVIRYFGGVKLGAGGLTRAYSGATEALLSTIELQLQIPSVIKEFICAFSQEQLVRHYVKLWEAEVINVAYADKVKMELKFPQSKLAEVESFSALNQIEISD